MLAKRSKRSLQLGASGVLAWLAHSVCGCGAHRGASTSPHPEPRPSAGSASTPVAGAGGSVARSVNSPARGGAAIVDAAASSETSRPSEERARYEACEQAVPLPGCLEAFPTSVSCPAHLNQVPVGELCGLEGRTRAPNVCSYPEATCACKPSVYCGGVAPNYLQQAGMRWSCVSRRAPGDCPGSPVEGGSCSREGQNCRSGGCGTATDCTCRKGKYRCVTQPVATPP